MKAKEVIRELKKIIKQNGDRDVNILIEKDYIKELKSVNYNPNYGGDGIVLE